MVQRSFIYKAMKRLLEEQQMIAFAGVEFQFVDEAIKKDTIPFSFASNDRNEAFVAYYQGVATKYFRLEKLDGQTGLAELSLLEAVDMEGNAVGPSDEFFALRKTAEKVIININHFRDVHALPPHFVNRPLPIIEQK